MGDGEKDTAATAGQTESKLSVCPGLVILLYFHFYVSIDVLWKGMVESCLLSKDELLTPNSDEVMVFEFLE